jgi:hypothetical protein
LKCHHSPRRCACDGVGGPPGALVKLLLLTGCRLDDLRFTAFHDPGVAPVATGIRPHLKYLLVAGRIIVADDVILGLDVDDLRHRTREAVRSLKNGGPPA